ncbi:hypothetical protein UC34_13630 [Pandoraea vervacti]|uniref:DUF4936 domain-containing protein n=1 Tax=Pandoraea vervacti TaxID=656178 RepID=A0ABM5SYX8_9BURK|nr:DUF4936 family protein [Pandoraea vervacti]AJP57740.1 hypothetical protein UC34_13630 [Pandoraea vervacti]
MDCYVYYRVSPQHAKAAHQAVMQLFALAAARFGVVGRIQSRADASANEVASAAADPGANDAPGMQTWMERYDDVGPAFVTALPELVAEAGLASLVDGERHVECFVDLPPPLPPCA